MTTPLTANVKPSTSAASSSESSVPTADLAAGATCSRLSLAEAASRVEPSDAGPVAPAPPGLVFDADPSGPFGGLAAPGTLPPPDPAEWPTWAGESVAPMEFCGGMAGSEVPGGFWADGSGVTDGLVPVGLPLGVLDGTDESVAEPVGGAGVFESVGGLDEVLLRGGVCGAVTVGSRPGGEPEFRTGGWPPDCDPLGPDGVGVPGSVLPDPGGFDGPVGVSVGGSVGVFDGGSLGEVGVSVGGVQVGMSDGGVLSAAWPPGPGCSA